MLLTLMMNLNMFGSTPPAPTPSKDSAPYVYNKPDEGGGNKKEKEIILNNDNEDIAVILASWIINNN